MTSTNQTTNGNQVAQATWSASQLVDKNHTTETGDLESKSNCKENDI